MMIHLIICFLLFFAPSPAVVTGRNLLNSTTDLDHQYPINFEYVVKDVQRRILASTSSSNVEPNAKSPCLTGNPIDDCWRCDPNWASDRQSLADCAIGFGHFATGGKGGNIYVVTDSSDDYVVDPGPGTLRHALIQVQPLWIIFSADMKMIKLSHELIVGSFKTIDGRGANISITGKGCITLHNVTNVIIHNIHVYGCVPSESADIRSSPTKIEHREKSEGDGISIIGSQNIWIDHCTISHCTDGLIDATLGSTAITISNNHFSDHESVMLLGHNDNYTLDKGMQVTIAFNHFGEQLTKNMPLCRHGYFHIVNNDYTGWKTFAIGGSANPTIISQGNRYTAPNDPSSKQVTARLDTDEKVWVKWDWRSDFDLMVNGAYFVTTRQPLNINVSINASTHVDPKSVASVGKLTETAGIILGGQRNDTQDTGNSGTGTLTTFGSSGETVGSADGTHTDNFGPVLLKILGILASFVTVGGLGYKCFFCNRVVNN